MILLLLIAFIIWAWTSYTACLIMYFQYVWWLKEAFPPGTWNEGGNRFYHDLIKYISPPFLFLLACSGIGTICTIAVWEIMDLDEYPRSYWKYHDLINEHKISRLYSKFMNNRT